MNNILLKFYKNLTKTNKRFDYLGCSKELSTNQHPHQHQSSSGSKPEKCFSTINNKNQQIWSILNCIYSQNLKAPNNNYACLLLNVLDEAGPYFDKFRSLYEKAKFKIVVDGSANYLAKIDLIAKSDVICGDFDSIDKNLIHELQEGPINLVKQGSLDIPTKPQIIETPSQRETDFTKAIRVAQNKRPSISSYIALYYTDGTRIDHLFGLMNTLYIFRGQSIFLINLKSNTLSWLLPAGNHVIEKPIGRELCSIIPFERQAHVQTRGLEYNPSTPLKFSGLISTSNMCSKTSDQIVINTDHDVIFSIDLDMESPPRGKGFN